MRDTQRQRLYDAEEQVCRQLDFASAGARTVTVAGSTVVPPLEVRFGSLDAAQTYVEAVRTSPAFAAIYARAARVPVRVRSRRGDRAATYEAPATIALHEPKHGTAWALRELVVLHELAHHGQHHDHAPAAPHGPGFAAGLLQLVTGVLGPEIGLLLTAAFAEHGVATQTAAA